MEIKINKKNYDSLIESLGKKTDFIRSVDTIYDELFTIFNDNYKHDYTNDLEFTSKTFDGLKVVISVEFVDGINQFIKQEDRCNINKLPNLFYSGLEFTKNTNTLNINFEALNYTSELTTQITSKIAHIIVEDNFWFVNKLISVLNTNTPNIYSVIDDLDNFNPYIYSFNSDQLDSMMKYLYFFNNIEEIFKTSDLFLYLQLKNVSLETYKKTIEENKIYMSLKQMKNFTFNQILYQSQYDGKIIKDGFFDENSNLFGKYGLDVNKLSNNEKINLFELILNEILETPKIYSLDEILKSIFVNKTKEDIVVMLNDDTTYDLMFETIYYINGVSGRIINKIHKLIDNIDINIKNKMNLTDIKMVGGEIIYK